MLAQPDAVEILQRQVDWGRLSPKAESAARAALRTRLVPVGLAGHLADEALACVAAKSARVLGREPSPAQLVAARAIVQGHMVELEPAHAPSLVLAMAAAAWALAGLHTHVLTPDDALAAQVAATYAPLWRGLGLKVGLAVAHAGLEPRRRAHAADITCVGARTLLRDLLRDTRARRQGVAGDQPHLNLPRGLGIGLLLEADRMLVDRAGARVVLSEVTHPGGWTRHCRMALTLAQHMRLDQDVVLDTQAMSLRWTREGSARLETLTARLGGDWAKRSRSEEWVGRAVLALHGLQSGVDYRVQAGRVHFRADRPWSTHMGQSEAGDTLQALLALKEGLAVPARRQPVATQALHRLFSSFRMLGGTAVTLAECRAELQRRYRLETFFLPGQGAARRETWPARAFDATGPREEALVARLLELSGLGRPVLVGVASASAAMGLSVRLARAGIVHQRVTGRCAQDRAQLARAGHAGTITVACAGALAGQEISLGPCVAVMGGLHVVDMLDSPCRRAHRRLAALAGGAGQPGSVETWHAADAPCWSQGPVEGPRGNSPAWWVETTATLQSRLHEWQARREREAALSAEAG
jgi:preprotein translocase subunit SecA